jgi:hypothetical protein
MPQESGASREKLEASVPAAGAAVVQDTVLGRSPIAGRVHSVIVTPEAAVVANAAANRTFRVVNKGQAGTGNTVVASFQTDTPTTDDLAAYNDKEIPLSSTPSDLNVAEGDTFTADEIVTGAGVAHSGYKIALEITR